MRKKLLLTCLLLICAAGISAQSLLGQWEAQMKEDKMDLNILLDIKENNKMAFTVNAAMVEENSMNMRFHIIVNGDYTRKDDILNLIFDQNEENVELKIDDIKFYGEAEELAKANPETGKFVRQMLEQQLEKSKGEFVKELPTNGEMKILQLTNTTLKLQSTDDEDKDTLEFTRK